MASTRERVQELLLRGLSRCMTLVSLTAKRQLRWSDAFPNIHYVKVDVDEVPDVAQEYNVRAMPTFLLFKDGEKVDEVVGANPPKLQALISANHPSS